jgi:glycosyltransferase involved in cell wall biosynthesis
MKLLFVDCYNLKWNGYSARNNEGIPGCNNALMYLAESISNNPNNDVTIVSTVNNIIEGNYLNVNYVNYNNFINSDYDYIIMHNNLTSLMILDKVDSYNKIIILTHNDLQNYNKLFELDKGKIIIGFISEFAKLNILNVQPFLKDYESILIYNSIDINDIPITNLKIQKENSICYFACIQRGYKMVIEILKNLENYKLYCSTYAHEHKYIFENSQTNNIDFIKNTSKKNILDYVSRSKYFIYPLIDLDNNCIHYDTFGYVVLEALLCGTIVICPRIKVYEELYGDAICYIDTDDIIPQEDLDYWKKHNANFGYPIINRYLEKIKWLDENENIRNSYIEKGLLLKGKFSNIKIGNELISYLEN